MANKAGRKRESSSTETQTPRVPLEDVFNKPTGYLSHAGYAHCSLLAAPGETAEARKGNKQTIQELNKN